MKRYDYYCNEIAFFLKLIESIKNTNKIIKLELPASDNDNSSTENIYFSVESCEMDSGGCGGCNNIYSSIRFSGTFNDKFANFKAFDYNGWISPRDIMCKCDFTYEEWNDFNNKENLLLDLRIERNDEYIYRIYIDDRDRFSVISKDDKSTFY